MGIMTSIGSILIFVLELYSWLLIARVMISWVSPDPYNPLVQFLGRATDPVLEPLRRLIPSVAGLDLSPIIALFGIVALQRLVRIAVSPMASGLGALITLLTEALYLVHLLLTFYLLLLFLRAGVNFYSWYTFQNRRRSGIDLYNPYIRFIYSSTEPTLRLVRSFTPTYRSLDLTPVVVGALVFALLVALQEGVRLLATYLMTMPGL